MSTSLFASIRTYGQRPGFVLEELNNAFAIVFARNHLSFRVTVAYNVLEWFIEIADPESKLEFQDWCDYTDYDQTPHDKLVSEMEDDLCRLFESILSREFRLKKGRTILRLNDRCEWLVDGQWIEFNIGDT